MRAPAIACALLVCVACTRPTGAVYTYRQAPAQVSELHPERPRYVYVAKDVGDLRLPAAGITLGLGDARTAPLGPPEDASSMELSLPGDVEARATARLSALVTGEGPRLALLGRVTTLVERREPGARVFEAHVSFRLEDAAHGLLFANDVVARVRVLDPPYDGAELSELCSGVLLEAVDAFLANDSLLALIAHRLSDENAAHP